MKFFENYKKGVFMKGINKKEKLILEQRGVQALSVDNSKNNFLEEIYSVGNSLCPKASGGHKNTKEDNSNGINEEFPYLAEIMNIPLSELKEEFFLFQITKLMSKLGRVIVRYNLKDSEVEKILVNSEVLKLGGITLSSAYIPIVDKLIKRRGLNDILVGSIIDFPFGESSFNSKISNVKEDKRAGVDEITVMLPTLLALAEQNKVLKKQAQKIGRVYKDSAGIAINATDLDEGDIKRVFKTVAKTKLNAVTLVFGNATISELQVKISVANKYKGKKKLFVLANVNSIQGVCELFKQGVDRILTPYADEIGVDLVKRFNVKKIKLH